MMKDSYIENEWWKSAIRWITGSDPVEISREGWTFWDVDSGVHRYAYGDNLAGLISEISLGAKNIYGEFSRTICCQFDDFVVDLPMRAAQLYACSGGECDPEWAMGIVDKFEGDKSGAVALMYVEHGYMEEWFKTILFSDFSGSRIDCAKLLYEKDEISGSLFKAIVSTTERTKTNQDPSYAALWYMAYNGFWGKEEEVRWCLEVVRKDKIGSSFEVAMVLFNRGLVDRDFVLECWEHVKKPTGYSSSGCSELYSYKFYQLKNQVIGL